LFQDYQLKDDEITLYVPLSLYQNWGIYVVRWVTFILCVFHSILEISLHIVIYYKRWNVLS